MLVSAAVAECAAPAQSGLAMCFPSAGSTVLYPATIELAANTGGVAIAHVSVYDGSVRVDDFGSLPGKLIDGAIANGFHKITVNLWDTNGKLYQAKSTFTVTGFGAGTCAGGAAAITVCTPSQGGFQPESSVSVATAFAAGTKSWSMLLDGKAVIDSAETGHSAAEPLQTSAFAAAGNHALVVNAVDAHGVKTTLTRKFSTFYDGSCNQSGTCRPGIAITQPSAISMYSAGDEASGFELQAEVTGNPKPTTKMILYLDGVKKEQSAGPGITADVTAAKGSHFIVILAWDTAGKMYETYGNVNVQ
jgi:hypothetical protein